MLYVLCYALRHAAGITQCVLAHYVLCYALRRAADITQCVLVWMNIVCTVMLSDVQRVCK